MNFEDILTANAHLLMSQAISSTTYFNANSASERTILVRSTVGMMKVAKGVPSVLHDNTPRAVPVVMVAMCNRNGLGIVMLESVCGNPSQELGSI